ncbi:MAG: hypothetical protein ABRQ24_09280 [Syntrophomonadaceae bacterium]
MDQGRQVTLVDLDTVEPFYTLRILSRQLADMGLRVISFSRAESFGLGETGAMLKPAARWALLHEGDIILDIGYGVQGAKTLNLVEGAYQSPELRIIAVVNGTRPMTNSKERVKEFLKELGRVDAVVLNTHLGDQSTIDIISNGNSFIREAADELGIPIAFIAISEEFRGVPQIGEWDLPVKYIKRYMPGAIW